MNVDYKKNNDMDEKWKKRISLLMGTVFLICIFLGWCLFDKSVLNHQKYKALADNQHFVRKEVTSHRGKILAQDFTSDDFIQLATNIEKYNVNVVPKNVKDAHNVASKLASVLDISESEIFDKINNDQLYIPPLKKRVDKKLADKIVELKLTGVVITSEDVRYYPENDLASHILGFVNFDADGKYGVEGYYDEQLKGEGGIVAGFKDTHGKLISVDISEEMKNGSDLLLTIDSNVQYIAQQKAKVAKEKYAADAVSIIIVNPENGAVIAMAADSTYDPNKFNEVAKKHGQNLFNNPLISNTWEPGSIFKPVVMGAAINAGKVQPDTEEKFGNMVVVQGYEIHTAEDEAFGRETMTQVLENSDNVAMVWVADKIGNEQMYQYFEKFGFGQKTNVDLEAEAQGSLLDVKKWRDIHRATMSFGQGIAVTPLQLVMAYSTIANNGRLIKPYIIDKIIKPDGKEIETEMKIIDEQVISEDTANKLKDMLVSVIEKGHGHNAAVERYKVAGKTGTSQIPDEHGGYKENEFIHSFGGFFPAYNPKFAMIVRLDKPKNAEFAAGSAAPVFADMAKWLLQYYEIMPDK